MESSLTTIGFSKIDKDYTIEDILSDILSNPSDQKSVELDNKKVLAEYLKEVGKNTYVMARVAVNKSKKEPKIEVYDCEPFVEAENKLEVCDVDIECVDDTSAYYVICEEKSTSMQLIFWLQNVVEYLEANKKDKKCTKIAVAALATEGTIVLPIEKDEEDESFEKDEREKLRGILQKMKDGDEEAKNILEAEEKELDNQLKERLFEEDFLTIMSGYFIPVTLQDAMYAVLGEILSVDKRTNTETKEEMYIFQLDVNDLPLEVVINAKELIGMPTVGMRFMGTCWLQGKVIME